MARSLTRFDESVEVKVFLICLCSNDNINHISKIELFDRLNGVKRR